MFVKLRIPAEGKMWVIVPASCEVSPVCNLLGVALLAKSLFVGMGSAVGAVLYVVVRVWGVPSV